MGERPPAEFFEKSLVGSAVLIGQALALWLAPAALMYGLWQAGLGTWPTALLSIPLLLLSAHGMHSVGLIGHEGSHFNLHRDRFWSARMGIAVSSLVPFHLDVGFAILHSEHHRWTNSAKDPDVQLFARYQGFWSRLLFARLGSNMRYSRLCWRLALGRCAPGEHLWLGFKFDEIVALARLNLALSWFFVALYAMLAVRALPVFLAFIALPLLVTILISGLRPYIEHEGTDEGRLSQARSWISPAFDFLYGGINYHLAHHLYPAVPAYRMRRLHRWLNEQGVLPAREALEIGSWSQYVEVASSSARAP